MGFILFFPNLLSCECLGSVMQGCGKKACCAMMKKVEDKVTLFVLWPFFFCLSGAFM